MKTKILGILVVTLLIATAVLPVVTSINDVKEGKDVSMLNKKCGFCQNVGQPIVLTVGVCDGFNSSPPAEPTDPSSKLLSWIDYNYLGTGGSRDCDETDTDIFWAHTFDLTGLCCDCCIVKATLEITVKNEDYIFNNDALCLGCIDDDSDSWDIHDTLIKWGIPVVGDNDTIVIDLSGDYPSFFSDMVDHCYLDVIVQDDSSVDCAVLTIWCCEPDVEFEKLIFDRPNNKLVDQINAYVGDTVTFVFHITNWGNCNFTRFVIEDTLPDCLEYIPDSSKIGMFQPGNPTIVGNVHTWDFIFPDELPPGYYLSMEFGVLVVSCGVNENCANVTAYCSPNCSKDTSPDDCATVNVDCGGGCINPPPDLVAWWPLDEDVGKLSADIIGDNHGTWQGSPTPVTGKVAGALEFPTLTDYVLVPDAADLDFGTGDFTIDCWVYPTTTQNNQARTIIDKRDGTSSSYFSGYCLFINEQGNLAMILGQGGTAKYRRFDSTFAVPNGKWTFVAAVAGRSWGAYSELRLFVNNQCTAFSLYYPPFTANLDNAGDLWIGKDRYINIHEFSGRIDEVELFDRALNEGELWQICFNGPKCKPNLCCNGSCSWSDVKPGGTVTCTFTVSNCGNPGSELDWEITSYPGWGGWSFNPPNGHGLTPSGSPRTITVTVTAPNDKEQTFTGEIIICNMHNPNDCCNISISLTTPKNKAINTPFIQFLEDLLQNHPHMFPLLRQLLRL